MNEKNVAIIWYKNSRGKRKKCREQYNETNFYQATMRVWSSGLLFPPKHV